MSLIIPSCIALSIFQQKFSLSYWFIKVLRLVLQFQCLSHLCGGIWHFLWKNSLRLSNNVVQVYLCHLLNTFFKLRRYFISKLELAWCCCGRNRDWHASNTCLESFLVDVLELKVVWLLKDFASFRWVSTW